MAGDWIKIEHVTPDKPEVMRIAEILRVNENEALGGLIRFWTWCDFQSRDGHALGVTRSSLSRLTGVPGMFDAMLEVGWLIEDSDGVHVPHYDYHLSENAKKRALAQKRKRKHRAKTVTQESRKSHEKNVTREEKRRDKNPPTPLGGNGCLKAGGLEDISRDELGKRAMVEAWAERNIPRLSQDVRNKILACSAKARRIGRDPPRLFLSLVRTGLEQGKWQFEQQDEDAVARSRRQKPKGEIG